MFSDASLRLDLHAAQSPDEVLRLFEGWGPDCATVMSPVDTLQGLVERIGASLRLRWLTPRPEALRPLRDADPATARQALVGSLNCIHPNRLQVIGHPELVYLTDLGAPAYDETLRKLFAGRPAAIIFADDITPEQVILTLAADRGTPVLSSPLGDEDIIGRLRYFLTHALAEMTLLHGVFMEVLGTGVLLVGDPAIGKSELALDLISRGHRLIADDAPQFARVAPETLDGTCPPLLRDFLRSAGWGCSISAPCSARARCAQSRHLNLIINLKAMTPEELGRIDRLAGSLSARTCWGWPLPRSPCRLPPGATWLSWWRRRCAIRTCVSAATTPGWISSSVRPAPWRTTSPRWAAGPD